MEDMYLLIALETLGLVICSFRRPSRSASLLHISISCNQFNQGSDTARTVFIEKGYKNCALKLIVFSDFFSMLMIKFLSV